MGKFHKFVLDLGIAAYILMHGYKVVGKRGKAIYFECNNEEESHEIDKYIMEYQPPNDFYTFDSCLMYLKKIGEYLPSDYQSMSYVTVSDLGTASYLMLHEYKKNKLNIEVIGKKNRLVYFKVDPDKIKEFEQISFEYLRSPFHQYDSCLMSLKKIGEYISYE